MRLQKVIPIHGRIQVITGLHIGASSENIEIGGLDNPIIKTPLDKAPYIPGSSLKGKMRYLIEIHEGRYVHDGRFKGNPCNCGQKDCPVCAVFGTSAANRPDDLGPTRLIVRDAHLSRHEQNGGKSWRNRFKDGELPMEIKYENAINRINGVANPRPLERVPDGVEFDFHMAFKVFEEDLPVYYETLLKAMKLLEMDALGGAGSRGSGQIKFVRVFIDGQEQAENFLDGIAIA